MSDRKKQLIETALEIIETEGYAALSMRSLAKRCDIKLASLQYHYPSRKQLLAALADSILLDYQQQWSQLNEDITEASLEDLLVFIFEDMGDISHMRLFPQLWAMALVEPLMRQAVDKIYQGYLALLVEKLKCSGSDQPKTDGLLLMAQLEGLALFVGKGQVWERQRGALKQRLIDQCQKLTA